MQKPEPLSVVHALWKSKFHEAEVIFLSGSVVRKEETPYSDLDLVVVYKSLKNAKRESLVFQNWQIEAFIHDPGTLKYFFEDMDAKAGVPSLAQMIQEGIAVPGESDFSNSLKRQAESFLQAGPPKLTSEEIDRHRYFISDLVDDLRSPRNREEAIASGVALYSKLADFWLRGQNKWSAKGKTIPRALKQADAKFFMQFQKAFDILFLSGDAKDVIILAESVLTPYGGYLFEGYTLDAPEVWGKD